jgi:hypothetical protein
LTFGPLIDAARQSQYESHVSEAKMTALLLADARGAAIEATVDEAIKNLDILVQRRASAYSIADDRTIEQTSRPYGLLTCQFTLYFPGSPHDGQKVSQAAMAAQDWAQAATSEFLLEADPD